MQKKLEITLPPAETDPLISRIREMRGIEGVQVQRGGSVQPAGDVISVVLADRTLHHLMPMLDALGMGERDDFSVTTTELASVVTPTVAEGMGREISDLTWEELELELGKESNMTLNGLLMMTISGFVATIGIATDAIHVVVGAMVIAPAFGPIVRVSMGLVTRGKALRRGLTHTFTGYLAISASAAACTLLLQALDRPVTGDGSAYLPASSLVQYWTSITVPSVLVSAAGGVAGALLVASGRAMLTAGVMIALALVPTAALIGVSLVLTDWSLLASAGTRWAIDVALVAVAGVLVFGWKRARLHRRSTRL